MEISQVTNIKVNFYFLVKSIPVAVRFFELLNHTRADYTSKCLSVLVYRSVFRPILPDLDY